MPSRLGLAVVGLLMVAGCASSSGAGDLHGVVRTPPIEVAATYELPDVTALDRRGRGVVDGDSLQLRAPAGRLLMFSLGYTNCPDVCPTTLAEMRAVFELLGADRDRVDFAFVTVDPERDTASVLNAYVGAFLDRFHVVRPTEATASSLADNLASRASVDRNGDVPVVTHPGAVYVVDADGEVVVEWPFGSDPQIMVDDLRLLLDQVTV